MEPLPFTLQSPDLLTAVRVAGPKAQHCSGATTGLFHRVTLVMKCHIGGHRFGFSSAGVSKVSTVTILLVEDIECWRKAIPPLLLDEPSFEIVCQVVNGRQAVLVAEQLQPAIVLMDISLPRISGIDAAKRIRNVAPSSKIIFLSEERDVEIVQAALKVGCGYVLKSDAANDLVAAIHSAVAGKAVISRQMTGLGLVGSCH